MIKRPAPPVLLCVLVATLLVSRAHAAVFVVDTTTDAVDAQPGDGLCATAAAQCALRAAIQEANASSNTDEITLPAGLYAMSIAGLDENAALTGDLDITTPLILRGAGPAATIIDGGALDRVLDLANGFPVAMPVRIENLTIRNGLLTEQSADAPGSGAGMRIRGDTVVDLVDVDVRDNISRAFSGAAGIDSFGCVRGLRLRAIGNRDFGALNDLKPVGGAFVLRNNAAGTACLELDHSELSDNHADFAGAIYADEHVPVTVRHTLIDSNSGRFSGALLLNSKNVVLLENVTISNNQGLAASLNDGGSTLTLRNCTVTGNTAIPGLIAIVGGLQDVHGGFGLTFLTNTIVAGNGPGFSADDLDRATSIGGGNVIGTTRGLTFSAQPGDQVGVDPGLSPLADNGGFTRTFAPGAAAIDHGVESGCAVDDQRGFPRPRDGDGDGTVVCDSGAVESEVPSLFADGFE
jgi:CSLREA domain-containing protein